MRNMDYNIAAIVILIFMQLFFRVKYSSDKKTGKLFLALLSCITITAVLNIVSDVCTQYLDSVYEQLLYGIYGLYLVCIVGCAFVMTEYVTTLINNDKRNFLDYLNHIIMAIHIILSIVSIWKHFYIQIGEDKSVVRGSLYIVIYLISAYYLIFSFIRMLVHYSKENTKSVLPVLGFIGVSFTGALCQFFLFGDNMIIYYVYTVAAMIMLFAFETPDFEKLIRTTEELQKSKKRLEKAKDRESELVETVNELSNMSYWVLYFDEKGEVTEANWSENFFTMLGYTREECNGREAYLWTDSLYDEDKERATTAFLQGMQGKPYNIEARLRDKSGDVRWFHCSGEAKKDENGKVISFQGMVRDINDEKIKEKLAEEKLQVLEELERSQEELKNALFAAEEANKAKTIFLSNMSHDIRTPMNAILGYTQLAMENISDISEVKNCLHTIQSSSEHLLSLINDVLDMSHIESGKVMIELGPCNLEHVMEDIKKMTFANVEARKQTYVTTCDIRHKDVSCDRLRLNQVLINCVGNAVKYTPEGGTIQVSLREEEVPEKGLSNFIFSVTDNGIGMSEEVIEKLFEPFERDSSERVGEIQGTGLGMAITKNLVDMMRGTIQVESKEKKGSEFIITIPLEWLENAGTEESTTKDEGTVSLDEKIKALEGKRFLVVDDNKINRTIVKKLLAGRGMVVEECGSGVSAIERLLDEEKESFDMVFMDVQMPGMNGYQTTEKIRQSGKKELENINIIAMTANAFEEDKQQAKEYGMNGHITKPFIIEELIQLLYRLLIQK